MSSKQPKREQLPDCNVEYQDDPDSWTPCRMPAVAKWTFPDGTVFYCCNEHDQDFEASYQPAPSEIPPEPKGEP